MNVTLSDEDFAWVKAQADDVGLEPAQMVRVLVNRMRKGEQAAALNSGVITAENNCAELFKQTLYADGAPDPRAWRNGALPADPLAHLPRAMRRLHEGTSHPVPPAEDQMQRIRRSAIEDSIDREFRERARKAALLHGLNPPIPDVVPLGNAALDALIAKPHDPTADEDFDPGPDVEIPADPDGGIPGADLAELLSGVAQAAAAEEAMGPTVQPVMAAPPNMPFSRTRPAGVSPELRGGSTPGEAGLNIVRENFSHLGIGRRG